jgi:hypothetical protein
MSVHSGLLLEVELPGIIQIPKIMDRIKQLEMGRINHPALIVGNIKQQLTQGAVKTLVLGRHVGNLTAPGRLSPNRQTGQAIHELPCHQVLAFPKLSLSSL